jgi:DNA-binding transcriptional ArsR family regulator
MLGLSLASFFREGRLIDLKACLTTYIYISIYTSMNLYEMKKSVARASDLMKAMSSENRLMLLCLLNDGEKSVNELASTLELRQASVSQQLALLRKDKLVTPRRDGQTVFYSLKGKEAQLITKVLYELYCPIETEAET